MATKIFSCRADEQALAFADALTHREYGISFGQYCGTHLLDSIKQTGALPSLEDRAAQSDKLAAAESIKGLSKLPHNDDIAQLSDQEIRDLIASRYC